MPMTDDQVVTKSREELEKIIDKALKKVQVKKENDLCRFLPGPNGGYIHHFTLKKLKNNNPGELANLIRRFVLEEPTPAPLNPRPRAPRGLKKRKEIFNSMSRADMECIVDLLRKAGFKDLVEKFSIRRSLSTVKRELIRTIRDNKVHEELWRAYVETINLHPNGADST